MNEKDKKDNGEKNQKTKIIGLLIFFMACVIFAAGYLLGSGEGEVTKFTEDDIETIIKFQETYEDDVIVYRGKDGELMIGLDD